jgi:DNA invertase Pin-like site-specific DNA recombinase
VKVVGYVRVSTSEQADSGLGLEAQRAAITDEAERRGWQLLAIHEEAGASAKTTARRPALARVLDAVEKGEADALVVAKLDRLSRSMADFTRLMERSWKKGWALVALDLGVDTTTPAGEMIANSVANFSQFERRLIGQRTKDALAVKKAQGVPLGRPRTMPDKIVRKIERLRAKGMSIRGIAERLNAERVPTAHGGARWHASTVQKVLTAQRADQRPSRARSQTRGERSVQV